MTSIRRSLGVAAVILTLAFSTARLPSAGAQSQPERDSRRLNATLVQEFWARVRCVYIRVYAEGDDEASLLRLEDAVATRLATVWRRELPERATVKISTRRVTRQLMESVVKDTQGPSGLTCAEYTNRSAPWTPKLDVSVKFHRMGAVSDLYYGTARSTFVLTLREALRNRCLPEECLSGPTFTIGKPPLSGQPRRYPMFSDYEVTLSPGISPGDTGGIYASKSLTGVEQFVTDTGEALIKSVAQGFYETKARLNE